MFKFIKEWWSDLTEFEALGVVVLVIAFLLALPGLWENIQNFNN